MQLQVGVKIILKNPEGKLLLLKRNPKIYTTNGQWDIPGGRINPGISLSENLKREITEETQHNFTGKAELISAQDIFTSDDLHIVRLTYSANTKEFTPIIDKEHIDYGWYSIKDAKSMDLDKYLLQALELI